MRNWIYVAGMMMLASPGRAELMPPAALEAMVGRFAGRSVVVDPRLVLPACAAPEMAWAGGGSSVMVRCAVPDWQVFVPVAGAPSRVAVAAAEVAIRRGDRVVIEAGGDGFVIGMEAVAEADSRDGRVNLRAAGSGRRLTGTIGEDGRVRVNGLNAMVKGR